jgi:hypothetical protein
MANALSGAIYIGRLIFFSNRGQNIGLNSVLYFVIGGRSGRKVPGSVESAIILFGAILLIQLMIIVIYLYNRSASTPHHR